MKNYVFSNPNVHMKTSLRVMTLRDNNTGIKPVDITQEISEEAYER
jgi:hypothetical protein